MNATSRSNDLGLKVVLALCLVVLLCPCGPVSAQTSTVQITSSPNPVGSGARALGMGGAFIAVADDATAASWNPGGLVQLERPEISAVGEAFSRSEGNTVNRHPEASGSQSVSGASLNYLSAAYPFTVIGRNMIVSLNYQHLYDFSRSWNFKLARGGTSQTINYEADGGLYAWGVAYGLQIVPEVSIGFTLNIWEDGIYQNGWESMQKSTARLRMGPDEWWTFNYTLKDRYTFRGFNANVGFLWHATDRLTVGGVFKSPFTADLKRRVSVLETLSIPGMPGIPISRDTYSAKYDLDMPMSYGIGLAWRFSDQLTVSADFYRTEWEDFVLTDSKGKQKSPITNESPRKSDIDATNQVRVGGEYLFIRQKYTIPARVGFFYDPAPAKGGTDNYFGFSLGTGFATSRFSLDAAYVCRLGRDVQGSLLKVPGSSFSQDVTEHGFYTSLIIYF